MNVASQCGLTPQYEGLERLFEEKRDSHDYGFKHEEPLDVLWNFEKFLISREGKVVGRFNPDVAPDHPALVDTGDKAAPIPSVCWTYLGKSACFQRLG